MKNWLCRCPEPTNLHTADEPSCEACATLRPPELTPLPADQLARFVGLVDWMDAQLARRPTMLASVQGLGASQLVAQARRDPTSTYRTIAAAGRALGATVAWVEDATPAPDGAFDMLGPEG